MKYKGVIFDLDGVIVTTDDCHYQAWKKLADEEDIYFDREINERLRGVSRMESLEIILENDVKTYFDVEKIEMANRKNGYYIEMIKKLDNSAVLPGVLDFCNELKRRGVKIAIGSSSKNARIILSQIGLIDYFDEIVDGNDIKNSKPAPDVFLIAAKKLGFLPKDCLVVEDAFAGVDAGLAAGMDVLAVGSANRHSKAKYSADGLDKFDILIIE